MKLLTSFCAIACVFSLHAAPSNVTPKLPDAKQPKIALGPGEQVFITFGRENAIYFLKSTDGGNSFSAPQKVGELKQLALGLRRGPRVGASKNTITVTAVSHGDGNLYAWHSPDHGSSWSGPVTVNSVPKSAREGMHDLAADKSGNLFVVWLDLRNGKTELFGAKSNDGGKSWEANTRIYRSPDQTICECCHPTVRFSPAGDLVVMWRNFLDGNRDLYRVVSHDGGRTFGPAAKLGTGTWPLQACPMDGGNLDISAEGPAYVWRREQRLFATTPQSPEILISPKGTHPVVVAGAEHLHFFWQDQGNLYRKTGTEGEPSLLAKDASFISALWSPAQNKILAAWEKTENGHTSISFDELTH